MNAHDKSAPIDLASEPDLSLGGLRIRPSAREVFANGQREVLQPRVMQVLVALARHRGEVVTKDQLIDACWAGRVVGDDAIGRCTAQIRRLAETHGGFAVETIARVGYRLSEQPIVLEEQRASATQSASPRSKSTITRFAAAAVVVTLALIAWYWNTLRLERAEDERLIVQASHLVEEDRYGDAFSRLRAVHSSNDARVAELRGRITAPLHVDIAEPGAELYFKPYEDEAGEWISAGVVPLARPIDAPIGALRLKVTKPGFRTEQFAVRNPTATQATLPLPMPTLPLVAASSVPDDMVVVPRTNIPVFLAGWTVSALGGDQYDIPQFAIARFEVTNQEYKEFVDAGGYEDPRYWQDLQFSDAGRNLTWPDARARFVDTTGRAGPAGWQLGSYPNGQADFPVGGVSWYEAVAYARFRKATLPTIHHWLRAAMGPYEAARPLVPSIAITSRFSAEAPGLARSRKGLGPWGTYHMLGNVREWVWNQSGDAALALGGAWSDYYAVAQIVFATQPMSRAPQNGIRLMQASREAPIAPELLLPITRRMANANREPVSDAAFEAMRFQFTIQHAKPRSVNVVTIESSAESVIEEVALEFETLPPLVMYIVRPTKPLSRLQPIIYAPPQNCCFARRPNREVLEQLPINRFVVDSGRTLIMPIWAGSYDTFRPADPDPESTADRQRRAVLQWQQELSSTLDYLASRADIDSERIGFLGMSYGVVTAGGLNLALEPRVRAAVFVSGGVSIAPTPRHPMIDIVNYAPRIKMPVLMINGRFDHVFPYEQSQRRLFALLGSPTADKAHVVIDTSHFGFGPNQIAMPATGWFDRYLGPVR